MAELKEYKIRPAGRLLLTIGRELIQDSYAAVVELVKNAYDADSSDVTIDFIANSTKDGYKLIVFDHGHGMSTDTVINKWMVPSTTSKQIIHTSPKGRIMQGRKGIGRYASAILGNDLLLETVTDKGIKTTVYLKWADFETTEYLDDMKIPVKAEKTSAMPGTTLTITADNSYFKEWNKTQFKNLKTELRKIIPPCGETSVKRNDISAFNINLKIKGFPSQENISEQIEAFPFLDLYDYKICGEILENGKGFLVYSQQNARNTIEEKISFDNLKATNCGDVNFDLRVFDRERESIAALVERSKEKNQSYLGALSTKQLLNEYNGIGVYRNGFRIRPFGDSSFDWLELNKRRVNVPTLKIGSNQVIGFVQIQAEEDSCLIEKSARDGLRANLAFENLKEITIKVLKILEEKRFSYRKAAGLSRSNKNLEKKIDILFSNDFVAQKLKSELKKSGIEKAVIDKAIQILEEDSKEKDKTAEDIRQAIAIYQGQATLGKIINVIIHEGRKPLSYFRNQIPRIKKFSKQLIEKNRLDRLSEIETIADGIGNNADIFVNLFGRLDPLAAKKRSLRVEFLLKKEIENCFSVFSSVITDNGITVQIQGDENFTFLGWRQDIDAIFTNLIDNSLFWMTEKKSKLKQISVLIKVVNKNLSYIDYIDSGPGIEPNLITSEVIFEPEFSTKKDGTGLGLAIAGESAFRNGLELKALESDNGAWFRIQPKEIKDNE